LVGHIDSFDTHVYLFHLLENRYNEPPTGLLYAAKSPHSEHDALFVLVDLTERNDKQNKRYNYQNPRHVFKLVVILVSYSQGVKYSIKGILKRKWLPG
jgi:hypothetical protein